MSKEELEDVARTIRKALRSGESCELRYPGHFPPLPLVFVQAAPVQQVGQWTERASVESAFPASVTEAVVDDAVLVAWLGVGSALFRLAGDAPPPTLTQLREAFPAASVSGLAAVGRLFAAVNHDPFAAALAAERAAGVR